MKIKSAPFIAVAATLVVALATVLALALMGDKPKDTSDSKQSGSQQKKVSELDKAKKLEKEASALIDTEPEKAKSMLEEAKAIYEKAEDSAKVAEVERNISSAETVIYANRQIEESSKDNTNSEEELEKGEAEDLKGLVAPADGPSPDQETTREDSNR